jgi:hypothetical protein
VAFIIRYEIAGMETKRLSLTLILTSSAKNINKPNPAEEISNRIFD